MIGKPLRNSQKRKQIVKYDLQFSGSYDEIFWYIIISKLDAVIQSPYLHKIYLKMTLLTCAFQIFQIEMESLVPESVRNALSLSCFF